MQDFPENAFLQRPIEEDLGADVRGQVINLWLTTKG
ncbi:hypothetical protein GQS_07590 [Thermococcus sp. 4557]|nr:hypothetical protein GQS_07590 [Thermococcus sp. 4557]